MRNEALAWADDILRSLIGDAIRERRAHPHRYALFHSRMVFLLQSRTRRPRLAIRWHAWLAARYSARAYALDHELMAACAAQGARC